MGSGHQASGVGGTARQSPATALPVWQLSIAAVMSFFFPGLGQIFKRQIGRGLTIQALFWGILFIGSALVFGAAFAWPSQPGLLFLLSLFPFAGAGIVWLWQLYDAAG